MEAITRSILLRPGLQKKLSLKSFLVLSLVLIMTLGYIPALPQTAVARTQVATLPPEDKVFIRLAGQNTALVQEERVLTLVAGINKVTFSWQNVHIDPDAIYLDTLADPDDITLLSVARPPDESALVWEIYSRTDTEQPVVVSYLLAGLDNLITYTALADAKEKTLDLDARIILRNFSGEDFANAAFWLAPDNVFKTDLLHLETRQVLFLAQKNLPITKTYDWDEKTMTPNPENHPDAPGIPTGYRIKNSSDAGLGFDLLPGKVRIFQEDDQAGTIFSGEDLMPFVPKGDTAFLQIGSSRDILVSKRRIHSEQTQVRRNEKGKIQVFDKKITDRFILENTTSAPVMLTLTDRIDGQWEPVNMGHPYNLTDHQTLVFDIPLEAKEKKTIDLTYTVVNIFTGTFARYNQAAPGN
ncbi:MAG: DUF4139 domain-containing protein [Desulfobacteraceae bacterium]|nr:DUF4139 domain-containing protein [Desulfobacteraceae bacterium]